MKLIKIEYQSKFLAECTKYIPTDRCDSIITEKGVIREVSYRALHSGAGVEVQYNVSIKESSVKSISLVDVREVM